jgi:predicted dehydrogenase
VCWAVVGSGAFATDWLAPGIAAARGAELTAVVSRDRGRAAAAAGRLGVPHAATALAELVDLGVDAVHIATPNPQHAPLAIEAAGLGLHVLVEKPMAATVAECRAMAQAAAAAGVLLTVGSSMAWAPPVEQAVRLVRDGAIGVPLQAVVWAGFDSPPASLWRQELATSAGGGPMFDLGAHAVDALIRMLGPVAGVTAALGNVRYRYPAEDSAGLLLSFRSGAQASVHLSFANALNALRVDGPDGGLASAEWLGRRFKGDLVLTAGSPGAASFGEERGGEAGTPVPLDPVDVFAAQAEETSAAIRGGEEPRNAARHGLAVVEVLEAAVASAHDGRRVDLEGGP